MVESIDPFSVRETYDQVRRALAHEGVSVLIARSPCVFLPGQRELAAGRMTLRVNADRCNVCFNHCDMALSCSRRKSPETGLTRARAKIAADVHIRGTEQLCPANICNHGFFNAVLEGKYKEALAVVRDKMLFSKVCGEICHRPCETLFRKPDAETWKSVPIRSLKKYVSSLDENFNDFSRQVESAEAGRRRREKAGLPARRVAVVGAGPAGLSAAYDLLRAGYDVTVYEREQEPGGIIRYIIPNFRLDKRTLEREISVLSRMGVTYLFNTELGRDVTVEGLAADYDAVILATGMWGSQELTDISPMHISPGKSYAAIEFLRQFNAGTLGVKPAATVLVIGGGNSALDAARAARRLDPSNRVIISCPEDRKEMPAFREEVNQAEKEGVEILDGSRVESIRENGGKVLVTLRTGDGKRQKLQADCVVTAIGQAGEAGADDGFERDPVNRVRSVPYDNVFAAGDVRSGNHPSLIGAIGSGKKAAVEVRKLLEDYPFDYEGEFALEQLAMHGNAGQQEAAAPATDDECLMDEIRQYDLYQPCAQCDHCIENFGCPALIRVDGKVTIDQARCTKCGLCIEVCPNNAIEWVEESLQVT